MRLDRRRALQAGGALALSAAGVAAGTAASSAGAPPGAAQRIRAAYQRETTVAGGDWWSYITLAGEEKPVVAEEIDQVVSIYSVNKIPVASAVWDKIERGELSLDQHVTLPADLIESSEGCYYLQTVYGDKLTLANIMVAMLLISDNTAVRMCSLVCPAGEVNAFLERKGFTHTRVKPKPDNPDRFFLGNSTPREMHTLLGQLVRGELVSARSTQFILGVMRGVSGHHDGIRHDMSSAERSRIATKFGAFDDGRHEAGIMFDAAGAPALTYVMCAKGRREAAENYGATHPFVQAHAHMGRVMYDAVAEQPARSGAAVLRPHVYRGSNGG